MTEASASTSLYSVGVNQLVAPARRSRSRAANPSGREAGLLQPVFHGLDRHSREVPHLALPRRQAATEVVPMTRHDTIFAQNPRPLAALQRVDATEDLGLLSDSQDFLDVRCVLQLEVPGFASQGVERNVS